MSTARWLRIKACAGRILLAVLVLSAAAGVAWYRRLADDIDRQVKDGIPTSDTRADMVTRDFRHVETRMDRTIWVLESALAEVFEEKARLHTVKITWYGEPGVIPVVITSEEGQVDFRTRDAQLSGKVRVERPDGVLLLTEELIWDDDRKFLRAPRPVVIITPSFTFRGESLDADLTTQRAVLSGRVQGEIRRGALDPSRPS